MMGHMFNIPVVWLAVGIAAAAWGWFLLWDAREDVMREVIWEPPDKKTLCDNAQDWWAWWLYGCFLFKALPKQLHAHCIGCRVYRWMKGHAVRLAK